MENEEKYLVPKGMMVVPAGEGKYMPMLLQVREEDIIQRKECDKFKNLYNNIEKKIGILFDANDRPNPSTLVQVANFKTKAGWNCSINEFGRVHLSRVLSIKELQDKKGIKVGSDGGKIDSESGYQIYPFTINIPIVLKSVENIDYTIGTSYNTFTTGEVSFTSGIIRCRAFPVILPGSKHITTTDGYLIIPQMTDNIIDKDNWSETTIFNSLYISIEIDGEFDDSTDEEVSN